MLHSFGDQKTAVQRLHEVSVDVIGLDAGVVLLELFLHPGELSLACKAVQHDVVVSSSQ